jgi:hypothetical protein
LYYAGRPKTAFRERFLNYGTGAVEAAGAVEGDGAAAG